MNHCLLEVIVRQPPTVRYTQDNQTPIAEMEVVFPGLRADDPQGFIKVVGWGNIAKEVQNNIQVGQRMILEGRLRMNSIPRQDGTKEKKAEFTLSKFHSISATPNNRKMESNAKQGLTSHNDQRGQQASSSDQLKNNEEAVIWDSSPLIPETDEIPF